MDKHDKWVVVLILGLFVFVIRDFWSSLFVPEPVNYPVVDTLERSYLESSFSVKDTVMIQLSGAVLRPGVYEVTENQRVGDVLAVGGGVLPNANLDRINLVRFITDGMRIKIPFISKSKAKSINLQNKQISFLSREVDVNYASVEELVKIPGIGRVMATRIVEYRLMNGAFKSDEDLLLVKGVGPKKLKRIRGCVRF